MGDYLEKEELYLAFLPQSHILEFAVEMIFMMIGLPIAYGRLQTLTDLGVIGCKNDIQEARPVRCFVANTDSSPSWLAFRKSGKRFGKESYPRSKVLVH